MLTLLTAVALASSTPQPHSIPTVKVAAVRSDRQCSLVAASWQWLLVECAQDFPKLREALQSALLDSKRVRLSTAVAGQDVLAPDLVVSASVSGLGTSQERASAGDYCVASDKIRGRLDYRVRRAGSGEVLYGGSIEKSVEIGSDAVAGASSCGVSAAGPGDYEQLERQIALAAARAIVFRIAPLRVQQPAGSGVELNYGSPFLSLGDAVDVLGDDGVRLRFRVTAADPTHAFAAPDGSKGAVPPNAEAIYVEQGSAADNARRFEKAELP